MSATNQLKELLNLPNCKSFGAPISLSTSQRPGNQYNSMSVLNDLNTENAGSVQQFRYNLPNNSTIKVETSSTTALFDIMALKVAIEGHESTNSYFTKIERLVDFNWEMSGNANWIAVNNRKPFIAYVIQRYVRQNPNSKQSNVSISDSSANQMIRIMNYETRHRCLAKGVFHQPIADLSFAINSTSSNSLDISKLSVADRGGNVYIYSLKEEENGEIKANQVLEIINDGNLFDLVRLSWCPYVPSDDDDCEVDGDPGLTLALSCDTRLELFSIDLLQTMFKDPIVIEISRIRSTNVGYQLIEKAHDRPITSLSIAQEVTAICTTGLDDKIRFYSVALNQKSTQKVFLKEWNLCNEYQYYQMDDRFSNFFFLDDFDFLLSQPDPIFWGYGLMGTRNGHIAVINLKDWRCKQSIRLNNEFTSDAVQEEFTYRMDLTAHYVLAIRGHDAFLLHIHFPHDKEEAFEDNEPINNNETNFDNSYPYVSKVSRFQIYSSPLRSFAIKKSIDDNVLIFWITAHSLELCHIDLSSITVEQNVQRYDISGVSKMMGNIGKANSPLNNINNDSINSSNIPNKDIDLMDIQPNGFDGFDTSLMGAPIDLQVISIPSPKPMPTRQTSEPGLQVSTLNLLTMPSPPTTFAPNKPYGAQQLRPESPASKEVQQILSPPMAGMSGTNALKSLLSLNSNVQKLKTTEDSTSLDSMGAIFPPKLPNILENMVTEEQILQLKTDMAKEMQNSETRVLQVIERLDHKLSAKLNANNEQLLTNSKLQTNKIETDLREMKKELKNACKLRNEEFNKIVEKLVNKVMHEMNVIVQKGFHELMEHTNKELKAVTKEFDKSIQSMQTKISQTIDNKATHFQPLAIHNPPVTPSTPMTPQQPLPLQQSVPVYYQTPNSIYGITQRKTPQPMLNTTVLAHSVPTTPLPYHTPNNVYNEAQMANSADQSRQKQLLLAQKQKTQIENEIWKSVGTGHIEQAITKALNLKDPELVAKICEVYKDSPSQMIDRIKSDQLVLISLLQQIIFKSNSLTTEENSWKTGFIEQIMTNLDLENEFVFRILPNLTPKLVKHLEIISQTHNDPNAEKAKILAFTFKHLRL